jgi:hypothetical protein
LVVGLRVLTLAAFLGPWAGASRAEETFHPDQDGFIRNWLILSPLQYAAVTPGDPEDDRDRARGGVGEAIARRQLPDECRLRPKAGEKVRVADREFTWKVHHSGTGRINFDDFVGGKPGAVVAYAVAVVDAPREMSGLLLKVGSDDGCKVYLNGRAVVRHPDHRAAQPDQNSAEVPLAKGENLIVFKVVNQHSDWAGYLRFTEKDGKPVTDLTIKGAGPDGADAKPDGEGFLRDWLILAPVPWEAGEFAIGGTVSNPPAGAVTAGNAEEAVAKEFLTGEAAVRPREGDKVRHGDRELAWRRADLKDWGFDLIALNDGKQADCCVAYAVCYVVSETERKGLNLRVGSDDQCSVRINGACVLKYIGESRGVEKDQNDAEVTLAKGVNAIVFKIVNGNGGFGGCLRFTDADGRPVNDLVVKLAP